MYIKKRVVLLQTTLKPPTMTDSNHDEALFAALLKNEGDSCNLFKKCLTEEDEDKFDEAFFGNDEEMTTTKKEEPATRQQQGAKGKPRRRQYAKISFLFGVDSKGTNGQWVSKKTKKSVIEKGKATKQLSTTRRELILKASREKEKKEKLERRQRYQQQQKALIDSRE